MILPAPSVQHNTNMSNQKTPDVTNAVAESTASNDKTADVATPTNLKTVKERDADVTLRIIEEHGHEFGPLTPEAEKKLKRKLYWHVMGLVSAINLVLFVSFISRSEYNWQITHRKLQVDKSSLGYAAILGLFEETGISKAQYNNLNTFVYVGMKCILSMPNNCNLWLIGYLAAQWPGHYLMQRLPFGKFVGTLVFLWSVVIFLHCVATRYAGLVVLRVCLGVVEAVIVPGIEITMGMFFNREEQSFLQPIF